MLTVAGHPPMPPDRPMSVHPWRFASTVLLTVLGSAGFGCADISVPVIGRLPSDPPNDASLPPAADANPPGDVSAASQAGESGIPPAGDAGALGSGPFGAVTLVTPLSDPGDTQDPTFTEDELELYFQSNRATGNPHLWRSLRLLKSDPWGTPQLVNELISTARDGAPSVASDGSTIWFESNRDADAGTGYDIWVSSRANRGDPWGVPQRVVELSSIATEGAPSIDDTGLVIVFLSDRAGGVGGLDIYQSTRPSTSDPWRPPTNLSAVNTRGDDWDPFIGGHDLQLFWAANRPNEEIRTATRASLTQPFAPYARLLELGIPAFDPTLSVDLRHIMFASSRSGTPQIYEAFR